jgi:hypothetical protein
MRGQPIFGIAKGEKPPLAHRASGVSGRAYCGKVIAILPGNAETPKLLCRRCAAIDESRRAGMPKFDVAP